MTLWSHTIVHRFYDASDRYHNRYYIVFGDEILEFTKIYAWIDQTSTFDLDRPKKISKRKIINAVKKHLNIKGLSPCHALQLKQILNTDLTDLI
jgi:hypothetical protein